ncbi:hypothetical protein CBR_g48757 [Chara braunii]|uniref:Uncharacterized protein n=1 Tax=Chara braunii TaxID=69332 RepID=A0A388K4M3_CHABU|nr:hypothetical protein CBR_g48757 [Chara braunii]|eukprot:GBG65010.1 hypothetical protein CBR_g48757 [Chara braunii]
MGRSPLRMAALAAFVVFAVLSCARDVSGIGCPANSSADSLRMVAEYMLHRPAETFGELYFDELRSALLFTVNSEVWRIPIDSTSTQVFVCNSSAQSYENAKEFAVDITSGVVHVGATEAWYSPVLYSIDYNGLQLEMKGKVSLGGFVGQWAGSPTCVLYVNSTKTIVTVFRQSGVVVLNGSNPYQPQPLTSIQAASFGGANLTSCILDERSNKAYIIGQNFSSTLVITLELGSYVISSTQALRPEMSGAMETIGVVSPDNNKLYLANSNFSQFVQADPNMVSAGMYVNYTAPGAYFHSVATDPFRKLIYYFSSDTTAPIFSLRSYENIPPLGPTRILPLFYTPATSLPLTYIGRNLTVYKATFAKYQDLAFFVTDPRGPSHGANVVAVSTSSCPDGNSVCASVTQGNCGCYANPYSVYATADVSCSAWYNYTARDAYPTIPCAFRR